MICFSNPEEKNIFSAVRELKKQKFTLSVSGRRVSPAVIKKAVRFSETIHAANHYGCAIELLLDISGYTYGDIEGDSRIFTASGVRVRVGALEKLLNSKRIAGRPKDKLFLKRFLMDAGLSSPRRKNSRKSVFRRPVKPSRNVTR